jgi:hypothetical protein
MKYWPLVAAVVLIAVALIGIHKVREKRLRQKRDDAYQVALRSYSEVLKPGITRREVEDALRARNAAFRQMCCVNFKERMDVWDDLVKIAQEDAPWFCSEKNIYIAFQFAGTRRYAAPAGADPSDRLTAVTVYP